jgi:hypothetical protein
LTKKPDKRTNAPINRAFEYIIDVLSGKIGFDGTIKDLRKVIQEEFDFPIDRAKILVNNAVKEFNSQKNKSQQNEEIEDSKNGTTPLDFQWNIKQNDLEILKLIHQNRFRNKAFENSSMSKSSFYRRILFFVEKGILVEIKGEKRGQQSSFVIHPSFIDNFYSMNVLPQSSSQISLTGSGEKKPVPLFEESKTDETEQNGIQKTEIEQESINGIPLFSPKGREKTETTLSKIMEKISKWDSSKYRIDIRKIRTHQLTTNLVIINKPIDLENLLENSQYFTTIHGIKNWKPFHNKGALGTLSRLQLKAYIRFNIDVITIAIPEIIGPDAYYNSMQGLKKIIIIQELLENEFHGLKLEPELNFDLIRVRSPEHAVISGLPALEKLAKESRQYKMSLKGDNVQIDESPGRPEAEFINKIKATTHIMREFQSYDFRAENEIYFEDLVQDLNDLKFKNKDIEDQVLKKLQEVENNLSVKIELESLVNQIELEKVRSEQLKFESSLVPFIQRLHDERESKEDTIIQTQRDMIDILKMHGDTLNNQQFTLHLLLNKILRKTFFEKLRDRLKMKGE